jgi:oxygen-dependent protoporphyrinogen oxidase
LKEAELAHYMDGEGSEYTLKGGLAVLVETLMEKIPDVVLTGKKVTNLYGMDENVFLMTLNDNESLRAKTVISTLSIAESAPLLNNCEDIGIKIPQAQVSSMGTILYRFEKGALTRYPEGYGFVIPKRSSFHITKISLLNRKWPSLKDADHDILLVEVGRRLEDTIVQLSDEAFLNIINEEVNEIFQVKGAYRSAKVYRWINNIPHLEANERNELNEITTIHKKRINDKGIFMGGNGFRGYGLPNAINEGKRLAREALAYMKAQQEL